MKESEQNEESTIFDEIRMTEDFDDLPNCPFCGSDRVSLTDRPDILRCGDADCRCDTFWREIESVDTDENISEEVEKPDLYEDDIEEGHGHNVKMFESKGMLLRYINE